ncbi:unnamed protein product, partial [marine sediment metagenome]
HVIAKANTTIRGTMWRKAGNMSPPIKTIYNDHAPPIIINRRAFGLLFLRISMTPKKSKAMNENGASERKPSTR